MEVSDISPKRKQQKDGLLKRENIVIFLFGVYFLVTTEYWCTFFLRALKE